MTRPSLRSFNPAVVVVILLIRGYQRFISPLLGDRCRFYPSCSQYALMALQEWGFFVGAWLTLRRLLKCGPWHEGGVDLPPKRGAGSKNAVQENESEAR